MSTTVLSTATCLGHDNAALGCGIIHDNFLNPRHLDCTGFRIFDAAHHGRNLCFDLGFFKGQVHIHHASVLKFQPLAIPEGLCADNEPVLHQTPVLYNFHCPYLSANNSHNILFHSASSFTVTPSRFNKEVISCCDNSICPSGKSRGQSLGIAVLSKTCGYDYYVFAHNALLHTLFLSL